MKPYPAYRGCRLKWAERIPEHWNERRARFLFRAIDERSETGNEELLSVSHITGVTPRSEKNITMFMAESYEGHKLCRPGDLVINSLWAWMAALGVSKHRGIISSAYHVYRQRDEKTFNPVYLDYLLRTRGYAGEYLIRSKGVWKSRLLLTPSDFFDIQILMPPREEQDAIVAFLEAKELDVQTFIANKRRMIDLLKEQKTALINRAVTGGLNPNAPLEPSGIPWLGDIPKHWLVFRIRSLIRSIDQGISPISEEGLADDEHWGVLKSGCANGGVFRPEEHKRLRANFQIDPQIIVREGDVLVSRASGSVKLVGSTARVTGSKYRLVLSDKTFRLNFSDPRIIDFAVLAMNSWYYRKQLESVLSGAEGLPNNLPQSELKDLVIALPPPDEIETICAAVTESSLRNDQTVATAEREIALMEEYRTALIAAAVTGRIDVRANVAGTIARQSSLMEEPA